MKLKQRKQKDLQKSDVLNSYMISNHQKKLKIQKECQNDLICKFDSQMNKEDITDTTKSHKTANNISNNFQPASMHAQSFKIGYLNNKPLEVNENYDVNYIVNKRNDQFMPRTSMKKSRTLINSTSAPSLNIKDELINAIKDNNSIK